MTLVLSIIFLRTVLWILLRNVVGVPFLIAAAQHANTYLGLLMTIEDTTM